MRTGSRTAIALASVLAVIAVACSSSVTGAHVDPAGELQGSSAPSVYSTDGIHKIRHVIVVMQENRSFDNYFGTFPGADGIPMRRGVPTVCVPVPGVGACVRPYHDTSLIDGGGPHNQVAAERDIDGGAMDGFARSARAGRMRACDHATVNPVCTAATTPGAVPDALGYHTAAEIPNYWAYAQHFVLQDHMFEGVNGWSLPSHLDMVSGWSARCSDPTDPMSCTTNIDRPGHLATDPSGQPPPYAWTDLTYLLDRAGISWRYFVQAGAQPDCANPADISARRSGSRTRPRTSGTRSRGSGPSSKTDSSTTSPRRATTSRWRGRDGSPRCRGSCRTAATASTRRPRSRTDRRG